MYLVVGQAHVDAAVAAGHDRVRRVGPSPDLRDVDQLGCAVARREALLQQLIAECQADSPKSHYIVGDLGERDVAERVVHDTVAKHGTLADKRLVSPALFLPMLDRVAKNDGYLNMARSRAANLAESIRAVK